jgi:nucleoid DNA-binding protein
MVKADLVEMLANAYPELTKKAAKEIVDMLFDKIQEALAGGDAVLITGFGKFFAKELKGRVQMIPGTDKTVNVPDRKVARFKPGKALKDAVR